jgi:hypothetical protein
LPAPNSSEDTKHVSNEGNDKSLTDWLLVIFTGLLVVVGVGQGVVFGWQGWQLRKTVIAAGEQSKDMKAYIVEAARAANAMEHVGAQVALSAKAAQDSIAAMRERSAAQMRAYLSVNVGIAVFQERDKGIRFEAKPSIMNNGFTPAYRVRYRAKAAIKVLPLPPDFNFNLPRGTETTGGVIGSHANSIMGVVVEDYVPDDDVEDIKIGANRKGVLHVWGVVEYDDIFGEPHETEFGQSIIWLPNGTIWGMHLSAHSKAT